MKKTVKKLALNRETVKNLEESELPQVAGAASEANVCIYPSYNRSACKICFY